MGRNPPPKGRRPRAPPPPPRPPIQAVGLTARKAQMLRCAYCGGSVLDNARKRCEGCGARPEFRQ